MTSISQFFAKPFRVCSFLWTVKTSLATFKKPVNQLKKGCFVKAEKSKVSPKNETVFLGCIVFKKANK